MAKAYLYDLTDTWNSAGTTFNAIRMSVTDTASAAGSLLLDLQVGGTSRFSVSKMSGTRSIQFDSAGQLLVSNITGGGLRWEGNNGFDIGVTAGRIQIPDAWPIEWRSGSAMSAATDLVIRRDAANTLAQRNSTNAQAFRVYNTVTDTSNYERAELGWSGNVCYLGSSAAGTGTKRDFEIGGLQLRFTTGSGTGGIRWRIDSSGHLLANGDNAYDIGASGANRPRNVYVSGFTEVGNGSSLRALNGFRITNSGGTDGVIALTNYGATDFSRLQFGGTTSAFPALKRNSTAINVRLADDSADAPLTAGAITAMAGTAIPAGGTQGAGLKVSSTADFGVFFGSGAPTLSAAKGSLYLRSDGTTTNDRMYVNTDGATTWTAVTTAS